MGYRMKKTLNSKNTNHIKEHRKLLIDALGGCCEDCNSMKKLQIHHKKYSEDIKLNDIEILCFKCHKKKHKIRGTCILTNINKKEFTARVSKMGRHKMINVPKNHPIKIGDRVEIIKIEAEKK